ncbi:DUF4861 family protein [uncultured Sunxiuqinia sp.]|jgi:uncharacterized protein DUF4861|uniref:DUF4861 family protein n=1 Tax=uncultured Sunxiuqinia sp. TaxID=1573825 RepID=UPI001991AD2A|nr:DUF4861 family protein [Sunxiuqinia sp.]|tara:strand:+ start:118824 stop:119681 length:858 start_codon:yes stop_codon:yes gene_type:complete
MKALFVLFFVAIIGLQVAAQNKTAVSLFWKDSPEQVNIIESETGDLYQKVGHHGPAVENEWLGLRLYFDHKVAIDVYNKTKPQLELEVAKWYPTPGQQEEGWGADQYKAGQTVGLGGVRLWDGEQVVLLNPVSKRTARVKKEANQSYMEMLSENVPYKGDNIDVLIRVTVYSGIREAKVEAFAFSSEPVQFTTGINYHEGTSTKEGDGYLATWGLHPEDVAAFQLNIGAAILYDPNDFTQTQKTDTEYVLISKPTNYLSTWITSACEKEKDFDDLKDFVEYLEKL